MSWSSPIFFCSQSCLTQFLESFVHPEIKPDQLNELVQIVVMETQRIQNEFDYHKKMRNTYFHLFKGVDLPSESYLRDWHFKKNVKGNNRKTQKPDTVSSNFT